MSSQVTPPVVTQAPPPPPPPPYRRRKSWAGPIVLIIIGVVFLLKNLGYAFPLFATFAKWWPVLLIVWGLVKILEYMQAKREGEPAPGIGAGGVVLVVFLVIFGLAASGLMRVRDHWTQNGPPGFVINDNDDLAELFGSKYQYSAQLDETLPAKPKLVINVDRGNVRLLTGTDDKMHITVRKTVYAGNQSDANRINGTIQPNISTAGDVVTVQWASQGNVRADMDILLPRTAAVDLHADRGDLSVTGRDGDLLLETNNGDVTVDDVKGNVTVHMRHGDLRAARVTGNLSADGRIDDSTLADIGGAVSLNGDFFGDITASRVGGSLSFHSSRTDLSIAKVEGTFRMSGDSVDASQLTGPVRVITRSKDIKLEQVAGDVRVDTTNGDVELGMSKMGSVEVQNRNSSITLRLPAGARFQVDGTADNGDISSDFSELRVDKSGNTARVSGSVGGGGPRVQLNNQHADIQIRKGM